MLPMCEKLPSFEFNSIESASVASIVGCSGAVGTTPTPTPDSLAEANCAVERFGLCVPVGLDCAALSGNHFIE